VAEWRHGLIVVLPRSLTEALLSLTRCSGEPEPYQRLCLEEAVVDILGLIVEERSPGWRSESIRAQALLELAARYIFWLETGGYDEETGWELLRRAYNSAAAALYSPAGSRLHGRKKLAKALRAVRAALDAKMGLAEAAALLGEAIKQACASCPAKAASGGYVSPYPAARGLRVERVSGLAASALPP